MNVKKDIRFRVYLAFTGICLLGLAIILKAATIQVSEGPELRAMVREMNTRVDTLNAERGNIYSEDGTLLCSTIPQFDVHVDFSVIREDTFRRYVDTLARCLAHLFPKKSAAQYRKEFNAAYKDSVRYYELAENIQYYEYQALRSFPIFNKGQRRGGLIVETKNKRVNPYGMLAYRTIGLWRPAIWIDKKLVKNVVGLEATCDSILSGQNGSCVRQRVVGSRWTTVDGSVVEPQHGRDIVTTLDMGIQDVAEHALLSILQQYQCPRGTCIVMEVSTGKIKAMVNLGYQEKTGGYWEDFNYAMLPSEPGSTFKLATLTALLKDKYINVNDMVNCEGGQKRFGNRVMHDSHHGAGVMPIRDAFAQSSNVGMATLAYEHYYKDPERFIRRLKELHLGEKTGIDLAGERSPRMIEPGGKDWSGTTLPWMATGYGVLITPLHTCMLYNAIANNGRMMKPYLIHAVREYGKDVKVYEPTVLEEQIADTSVIRQLRSCTEQVVLTGTGKHIQSPHYKIAGKTGTAQVADKGISYAMGVYQGSFVGYFPADRPRYTICVVIRTKPHSGAYYGGTIAAPVFRMVSDKIFAAGLGSWTGPLDSFARVHKGSMPGSLATAGTYNRLLTTLGKKADGQLPLSAMAVLQTDSNRNITIQHKPVVRGLVPDVTGMGLKDAVYLLEKEGLQVLVQGSGTVQSQSIAPGSAAAKGQTIVLQLS